MNATAAEWAVSATWGAAGWNAAGWGAAGLVAGSFAAMAAHRLPARLGLVDRPVPEGGRFTGRSRCPACDRALGPAELIPIVSFLVSQGRCRGCAAPIPMRYPVIEALGAAAGALAALRFGGGLDTAAAAAFAWTLVLLAAIDARDGYLPDALTIPLLWAGLLVNVADRFAPLSSAVIGAAGGYLALRAVETAHRALRGRDGLGRGDAALFAAVGAWLGWERAPAVLLAAALGALAFVAARALVRREPIDGARAIAFGPALAAAAVATLFAAG